MNTTTAPQTVFANGKTWTVITIELCKVPGKLFSGTAFRKHGTRWMAGMFWILNSGDVVMVPMGTTNEAPPVAA